MLTRKEVLLFKIESTYGVDSVPTAATDAVLIENSSPPSSEGLRMNERIPVRGTLGMLQHVYGGRLGTVSFDVEFKGSQAAGTPPEYGQLLRACGLDETIVASTSVAYQPVSDGQESGTLYYYQDGIRYIMTGCRGNFSLNAEVGAIPKLSFTMTGHINSIADAALVSPTVSVHAPAPFIGTTFTVGGVGQKIAAISLDLANSLVNPPDVTANDGYGEVRITARDPNGSYDPEAQTVATDPVHSDLELSTQKTVVLGPVGAAGNRWQLDMPAVSYRDVSPGDRDGLRTYEIPYGAAESAGDDEVVLTFT